MTLTDKALKQRAELTYKANRNTGRHGWLRLTPAYSMKLVREQLSILPEGSMILEPFSGSGTTPLTAQEMNLRCEAREINPFLVWFGNAKLAYYSNKIVDDFTRATIQIGKTARNEQFNEYWTPPIFKIEKWWSPATLKALAAIKQHINEYDGQVQDLLNVAFCRTMINTSNASFNHQSMSFKTVTNYDAENAQRDYDRVLSAFEDTADFMADTLATPMQNTSHIQEGDSTTAFTGFEPADLVITSPPYVNRMSYIRELRPYMYWMGFLDNGAAAGELDWKTTGGTWGSASTKVKTWEPTDNTPVDKELESVCAQILEGKSGQILSPYVRKYFHDMWNHFKAITPVVKSGGRLCYIVGNSTFSGNIVPAQQWYADMMSALGYHDVHIDTIRKRNSNKQLFEFAVCATKA